MNRKKKKICLILILLLHLFCSLLLLIPDFPIGGDNDELFLLGRSISQKHKYQDIYYPSSPPHTKQPFFYPLILALGQFLFGENIILLRLISVLFGTGSLILVYLLFKKKISFLSLLLLLFFTATNPFFLIFSTSFASEMPYLFFSLLFFIILEKYENQKRFLLIAGFLLVIIFFTRCIGASLMVATFFYFITEKKYRQAFLLMCLCSFLILPWEIRSGFLFREAITKPYIDEFIIYLSGLNVLLFGKMIIGHIVYYFGQIVVLFIPGYFIGLEEFSFVNEKCFPSLHSLINNMGIFYVGRAYRFFYFLSSIILSITVIIGLFSQIKKKDKRLLFFYIFSYSAILLIHNGESRYLFPLLPFILYFIIKGVSFFVVKRYCYLKQVAIVLIILFHFYYNLIPIAEMIYNNVVYLKNYKHFSIKMRGNYHEYWHNSYFRAAPWIEQNTSPNAVVISDWAPAFYLYSHRQGVFLENAPCWPNYRSWEEIKLTFESGIADYFVVSTEEERKLLKKLNKECQNLIFNPLAIMFEPEIFFTDQVVRIYKLVQVSSLTKSFFEKGLYNMGEDNYVEAIPEFEKVINMVPGFFGVYYQMGVCFEKKGLLKQACVMYRKAVDLQPNYEIAKSRLAILQKEELIRTGLNDVNGYLLLGNLYLNNHNFSKAINLFKNALKLNPTLSICYYNLGIAYAYQGNYGLAILHFKKAMRIDSSLEYKAREQIRVNHRRRIIRQCGEED